MPPKSIALHFLKIYTKNNFMKDYQKNITVTKSAGQVYTAITVYISEWWSNDLVGNASQVGDSFTIAFDKTQKTFKIIEAKQNKEIVWECTKAYIDMTSLTNKAEWEGTRMIWTILEDEKGTHLTFLHQGLNPSFECYQVCEAGWDMFLKSLEDYLTTGKGAPFLKIQLAERKSKKQKVK
jgi:hypothetical protein